MSLNWNQSAEVHAFFSPDLFSCQCEMKDSGTTRAEFVLFYFGGRSRMEENRCKGVKLLKYIDLIV